MNMDFEEALKHLSAIWNNFESELIYNNRFFPKTNDILERIECLANLLVVSLEKEKILFRAREYTSLSLVTPPHKPSNTDETMYKVLIMAAMRGQINEIISGDFLPSVNTIGGVFRNVIEENWF